MEFSRNGVKRALVLPPRSLLVLDGEARYGWCLPLPILPIRLPPYILENSIGAAH